MDVIAQNHVLAHRGLYHIPYHVFVVRDPEGSLPELGDLMGMERGARYYQMRLRRLVSVARRARHGLVLSHEQLVDPRAYAAVAEMLGLRGVVPSIGAGVAVLAPAPYQAVVSCNESYARCLHELRGLFPFS